jgi:hypothetical protein
MYGLVVTVRLTAGRQIVLHNVTSITCPSDVSQTDPLIVIESSFHRQQAVVHATEVQDLGGQPEHFANWHWGKPEG